MFRFLVTSLFWCSVPVIFSTNKEFSLSYKEYLKKYQKDSHRIHNNSRHENYHRNIQKFQQLDEELRHNTHYTFHLKPNHFLDWFDYEINAIFSPINMTLESAAEDLEMISEEMNRRMTTNSQFNDQINWASSLNPLGFSILTPIQNQGECGACWAFAAAEATAASLRLNGYPLVSLSAQELLDCDVGFNSGCSGGNPAMAYEYIMEHGITTALSLPYRGYEQRCYRNDVNSQKSILLATPVTSIPIEQKSISSPIPVASIRKFIVLPSKNEFFLKEYVNTVGPVSVGICGTDAYFIYYGGGIFNTPDCCTELNHAVVIVGYGTDATTGLDYWIAQNSWGERWGEKGFIRLARYNTFFSPGQCGIAIGSSIPINAHLLVPEKDIPVPNDSHLWDEWFERFERWSLSNIQDIIYGFSAIMVFISISLFCCGLCMDLSNYISTDSNHYDPVPNGYEGKYGENFTTPPVHATRVPVSYYQSDDR